MEINKILKQARLDKKVTQEDLAEELGVSRQTISSWENDKSYPDIISIIKMSDYYNVSLDKLLKEDKNLIKNIQKDTNVVKSNKNIILTIILGIIIFGGIYTIRTFVSIPKIDDPVINIIILSTFILGVMIYLLKSFNFKNFLNKKTENRMLVKIVIIVIMLVLLFALFPLVDLFLTVKWQIFSTRILILLVLASTTCLIINKLDKQ